MSEYHPLRPINLSDYESLVGRYEYQPGAFDFYPRPQPRHFNQWAERAERKLLRQLKAVSADLKTFERLCSERNQCYWALFNKQKRLSDGYKRLVDKRKSSPSYFYYPNNRRPTAYGAPTA